MIHQGIYGHKHKLNEPSFEGRTDLITSLVMVVY